MATKPHEIGRKIWFKSKRYGWGFAPATWQGWLVLAVWLTIVVAFVVNIDSHSGSISDTLYGIVPFVLVMTLILVMISYSRGERPKLQWRGRPTSGKKKKH